MGRYVVGVSGASGVVLAQALVHELLARKHQVELIVTPSALYTASLEMGKEFGSIQNFLGAISEEGRASLRIHAIYDMASALASGSYATDGMVVIPCSMASLAAISTGLSDNLLRRAADVTLKEKRTLVLVPRESPLSEIHLEHMLRLARMGASIVPPVPAWYTQPKSLADIHGFIVGKALDALRVDHALYPRWT